MAQEIKMAEMITSLTDYVKQNPEVAIKPIVLSLPTIETGVSIQTGIKFKERLIDQGDNEAIIQTGDYTSADANGTFDLSEKDIAVTERFIKESYTPMVLNKKISSLLLAKGSEITDIPMFLKDSLVKQKVDSIKKKNEQSLWLGDTTASTATPSTRHLADFDGFIKLAHSSAKTIKSTVTTVALTSATAISKVSALIALLPEDVIAENTTLYMSVANAQIAIAAYMEKYSATQVFGDNMGGVKFKYQVPGTNVTIQGLTALSTSNQMLLARPVDLYIGVDLKGEDENAEFRKMEDRSFELFCLYKLGAQIGKDEYIVVTKAIA